MYASRTKLNGYEMDPAVGEGRHCNLPHEGIKDSLV